MQDTGATLPVLYIRQMAEQVRAAGADVERWLTDSGLSPAALADPALTISYAVFERLARNSLVVANEPALGLLVGARLMASTHGILGYAALTSGTIRQAIDLLERFVRLRLSLLSVSHQRDGDRVRVQFRVTRAAGDLERPLLEAVLLSVKNVFDAISMGACRIAEVVFPFPAPGYERLARDLFGGPVRYGADWAGFLVPAAALDVPLALADPDAFAEATRICQREVDKLTANESLAARVRRLLYEKQNGFPSLAATARLFHLTPRTLHRRLGDEGTSFRALLEEVRHRLAVEHLKSGRFGVEQIAYTLGYSDLANFRRAFKRWESMAPSQYRERHAPKARRPR